MASPEPNPVAPETPHPLISRSFDFAPTYNKGDSFKWTLEDGYDTSLFSNSTLNVHIDHVFAPFTCSPVMRVTFDTNAGPKTAILKTYDRREGKFTRIRPGDYKYIGHNLESDADLVQLVHEGRAGQLLTDFYDPGFGGAKRRPIILSDTTHRELYFQWLSLGCFEDEVKAYKKMSHLQGDCIPRFIAAMTWRPTCANAKHLTIGAILIEEIENATTLVDFFEQQSSKQNSFDQSSLHEKIDDECGRIVDLIKEAGVRDQDRHDENTLIVMHDLERQDFRLIAIDFGLSAIEPVENESSTEEPAEEMVSECQPDVEDEPAEFAVENDHHIETDLERSPFEEAMNAGGMCQELPFRSYRVAEAGPDIDLDDEMDLVEGPSEDELDAEGEPEEDTLDAYVEIYDAENVFEPEREEFLSDEVMEPAPINMPAGKDDETN